MAIKASAQITISKVIDIYACYRYYKPQSSTLAKPSKPTINPPSGWSDIEPAYVSGSTNTLYFVDCNVYSDKSFSFSEVSKSSSYEAAKDAWNKANNAIKDVDVEYYLSTSATSLSGGSWSTTAPTWVNDKYMWSRTVTVDGAGNKTYSPNQNGVCIAGAKGDKGDKGATGETGPQGPQGGTGATGKGVSSIVEQYYKSTSSTELSGGAWSTTYPGWENGKYIWTRSVITYTDTNTVTTAPVCVTGTKGNTGDKGDKGDTGPAGKGISSTEVTYQASTSGTSIPKDTWATSIPSVAAGSYLWTRTIITYTDKTSTTSYAVGKMGNTGATGKGIKSTSITYQAHSNGTTAPTGTWTDLVPTTSAEKPYLWSRTILTYTDNTTSTTYSVGSTPDGVLDEIKKVLRYDDTKITLGRTGSNITLNLQNDKMSITNGEDIRASFESDKLTLGNGYLVLGYDDTASGIGAYLTSSEYDAINLVVPAVLGSIPNGDNISSRLHMWGGPRPAIELSNSEGADLLVGVIQDEATSEYGSLIRLNAEYIKLQATKKLTYNIPVLESQDCNALTESGKYYIGNKSTNLPENTKGWLECMKYSTNYCAQTYTTSNGKKYTRYQQNGTWGAWFRVWQSRQLFGNESQAMNTAIGLNDTAANYDMLEIFYKSNDDARGSVKIYSPNGKKVSLTSTSHVGGYNNTIVKSKMVTINGSVINTYKGDKGYWTGEGNIMSSPSSSYGDNIGIIRVLGWR